MLEDLMEFFEMVVHAFFLRHEKRKRGEEEPVEGAARDDAAADS